MRKNATGFVEVQEFVTQRAGGLVNSATVRQLRRSCDSSTRQALVSQKLALLLMRAVVVHFGVVGTARVVERGREAQPKIVTNATRRPANAMSLTTPRAIISAGCERRLLMECGQFI